MNIVILDGHPMNPGDLSWKNLEALGDCTIFSRTALDERLERLAEAQIAVVNKTRLDRGVIEQLPQLKMIAVTATGYDCVDIAAAKERGIPVCNVPEYSTTSVAQAVFALLLELTHQVGKHAASVRAGDWERCPDFSYTLTPLVDLSDKTLGLVGYGRIGKRVAEIAHAMGMNVIVHTRTTKDVPHPCVPLDELFQRSDVLSLHCPLTVQTSQMVDARRLKLMKPTAFLINTARGKLIDEAALASALEAGNLAGAGLDVLSVEPPDKSNPLLKAKNCIVTPHLAWATYAARSRLMDVVVENIRAFQLGKPQNVVNA